jgi:hypothetical protein
VIVSQRYGVSAFDMASGKPVWQVATPCADLGQILSVSNGRFYVSAPGGWLVLGGDKGPNKTSIHQMSGSPLTKGIAIVANADAALLDSPSANGFPVVNLKASDQLTVTGSSVSAEGKIWWPVSDSNGDNGYLPEDVLTVTGCPSS